METFILIVALVGPPNCVGIGAATEHVIDFGGILKILVGLPSKLHKIWSTSSASMAGQMWSSKVIVYGLAPCFKTTASKSTRVPFAWPLGTSSLETNKSGA
jgi:hypothetical protein